MNGLGSSRQAVIRNIEINKKDIKSHLYIEAKIQYVHIYCAITITKSTFKVFVKQLMF